jgi:ribose 5-phosphate isomerase B
VLALGGRILAPIFALAIVDAFMSASFQGGRHERRLAQITEIEEEECS